MSSFLSTQPFASLPIDPQLVRALKEVFGYEYMSKPQVTSIPAVLTGRDVLVQARTGSGKTLGFLVPAFPNAFFRSESLRESSSPTCRVLVLSPSRELAMQTREEAAKLLGMGRGVQLVIGGTDIKKEQNRLQRGPLDVVVATPGRLIDHLEKPDSPLAKAMRGLSVLVLDEADRLLDAGFAPAIASISRFLPPKDKRQTLLFTATVPQSVIKTADALMRANREMLLLTSSNNANNAARPNIKQTANVYTSSPMLFKGLSTLLLQKRHETESHKIIVFLPTARMAQFMAEVFRKAGMPDALELHSRLSQSQRTAVTKAVATSTKGVIVFASDVIARGVDFPDVTLVVQVGLTDPEQYIHRVGRTGRGGKSGEAALLILEDEAKSLLSSITAKQKVDVVRVTDAKSSSSSTSVAKLSASSVLMKALKSTKWESAFSATLGFYNSNRRQLGWDKPALVRNVKERFAFFAGGGQDFRPQMSMQTLKKMQLADVASEFSIYTQHNPK